MNRGATDKSGEPKTELRPVLSARKKWMFRVIALGVPTFIGAAVLIMMMAGYRFLVIDPQSGRPVIQQPLYLEEPGHQKTGHRYLFDARLGWRNIPNWKATTYGHKLTINSKGLRDREYSYEKPAGVTRILVLGDSFTWGYGVADDEIYTEVLEQRLAGSSTKIEVINSGVSGWGNDQEYLFLIDEGFRYSPDVVVLAFFLMNDPPENVLSRHYEMNKPVFLDSQLTLGNTPVPKPDKPPREWSQANITTITLAILKAMSRECVQRGARLVIMKFGRFLEPNNSIVQKYEPIIAREIGTWSGTYYLDLDDEFERRDIGFAQLTNADLDGHWNTFGHRVTAEILHEFLIKSELVEGTAIDAGADTGAP